MSEQGAGNPSTHGATGGSGAGLGDKVANFFKEGNKMGEELRGNVNSFADNAFQKPGQDTPHSDSTATTSSSGAPAHESTGFSKDAQALGNAVLGDKKQ